MSDSRQCAYIFKTAEHFSGLHCTCYFGTATKSEKPRCLTQQNPPPHEKNEAWKTKALACKGPYTYDVRTEGVIKSLKSENVQGLGWRMGAKKNEDAFGFSVYCSCGMGGCGRPMCTAPSPVGSAAAREIYLNCSAEGAANIPRGHSFKIKH